MNGTPKQNLYAQAIKAKIMSEINEFGEKIPSSHKHEFEKVANAFESVNTYYFWIANKNEDAISILKKFQAGKWSNEYSWVIIDGAIYQAGAGGLKTKKM